MSITYDFGAGGSLGFAASMSEPGQDAGRESLYGPVVPIPADAPDLDRLLGFAGRDPHWRRVSRRGSRDSQG